MEGSNHNKLSNIQIPATLNQIVFNLNDENLELSVQHADQMNLFEFANFPYSFNYTIYMLACSAFSSLRGGFNTYLSYMKSIQTRKKKQMLIIPKLSMFFLNIPL